MRSPPANRPPAIDHYLPFDRLTALTDGEPVGRTSSVGTRALLVAEGPPTWPPQPPPPPAVGPCTAISWEPAKTFPHRIIPFHGPRSVTEIRMKGRKVPRRALLFRWVQPLFFSYIRLSVPSPGGGV